MSSPTCSGAGCRSSHSVEGALGSGGGTVGPAGAGPGGWSQLSEPAPPGWASTQLWLQLAADREQGRPCWGGAASS